ncbi:MAG: spore germination protein [Roseburia sp.]|nr:spore germination protein [Roseburia sp.]
MNGQQTNGVAACASENEQNTCDTVGAAAKQATSKQLIAVVFILALATNMFLLPIFLIKATGRDAYIAIAAGCIFDLLCLFITLVAMKRSPDCDLFTLLESVIGKIGAKIVVALTGLFMFFKLNIAVAETLTFYTDNVFADFDVAVMIIVLLLFLATVASHTLRAFCRLNEFLTPIIIVCVAILAAIVIMTGFDLANIFPALRTPQEFTHSAVRHSAWIGDFMPLLLFLGRTGMKKRTCLFAAASGTIGAAVSVFFSLVLCAAFGNVSTLVDSSTNLSSILQFSIGNVYGRIDLFSSILWSISAFLEAALFFYAVCRCVSYVIGKYRHFYIALAVGAALYFTQVFAFTDPTIFSLVATSVAVSVIVPTFSFVVPALALVCAIIKGRRDKRENTRLIENAAAPSTELKHE